VALRGTLKDFGIAEIFQLIGGQGKSGTLYLENKRDRVALLFDKGAIVGCELNRDRRGSLADMLVRAELLTAEQVREALAVQRKTLRRLADLVAEQGWVKPDLLHEMVALETNEALYGLFSWHDGTYRFEPGEVTYDPREVRPRSLEHLLMEGFRRVDEWPIIQRRIGGRDTVLEVVAPLPSRETADDVGPNERRVFSLIAPDHDVQRIIDLSRLGEFETCRALQHLLDEGYVRIAAKRGRRRDRGASLQPVWRVRLGAGFVAKGILALGVVAVLVVMVRFASPDLSGLLRGPTEGTVSAGEPRALLSNAQIERLQEALRVYQLEKGKPPERLEDLVEEKLIYREELRYPWRNMYEVSKAPAKPGAPPDAGVEPLAEVLRPVR
jgi:hypothetical protein